VIRHGTSTVKRADTALSNSGNFSFRRSLREAMGRLTPHALAFYEYVTPRTFAVAYFAIVIALLGVTLPILGVRNGTTKVSTKMLPGKSAPSFPPWSKPKSSGCTLH
jgi:hypothetical protein